MAHVMTSETEISLAGILAALRRQHRVIFLLTAVSSLVGLLYAFFATPLYTATIAVMPSTQQDGGTLSTLAARLGPAAALAGINLGSGGTPKETYLAVLRSQDLAQQFIERYKLLPELFPERWDAEAGQWRSDGAGPLAWLSQKASWLLAKLTRDRGWKPRESKPSDWEAYDRFSEVITITESPITGIVSVSFELPDPERAAFWANRFIALANEQLRERAVREASKALEYLNDRVEATNTLELRGTLYRLIEANLEEITLANVREEFAFTIIDAAAVPEERSHPQRVLTLALSFVIGVVLGIAAALTWDAFGEAWRKGSNLTSGSQVS
ncbi:MAG TPA: Wzz/FepE/Etk N-terminal domain-containing protein [Steroidobacter sp.]